MGNENKKYKLINKTFFNHFDKWLYQIEAISDFGDVKKGDRGGFIEREENLSHEGMCWVRDNAMVYDHAVVAGNAIICDQVVVSGHAKISGDAHISGHAAIYNDAIVFDRASISGYVVVSGNACIHGNAVICNTACIHGYAEIYDEAYVSGDADICEHAVVHGDAYICGCSLIRGNAHVASETEIFTMGPFGFGDITCTPDKYRKVQISCGYYFLGGIEEFCQEMVVNRKDGADYALFLPIILKKKEEWINPPSTED